MGQDFNFVIAFANSTSSNFEKALKLANRFTEFEAASGTNKFNTIKLDLDETKQKYPDIQRLWELISSWKGSSAHLNEEAVTREVFGRMDSTLRCNKGYDLAVLQDQHCKDNSEGWGCKHLNAIQLNPNSYDNYVYYRSYQTLTKKWFDIGHFKDENIWVVNKKELRRVIDREIQIKFLYLCNAFKQSKIDEIIDSLPSEINLSETTEFEIKYEEISHGITVEKRAVGIKKKSGYEDDEERTNGGLSFSLNLEKMVDRLSAPRSSVERHIPSVKFSDIGGIDEIILTIREVIELPLKKPELFQHMGIKPHKGILLYGPPGCGKTLIAKAIANEVQAHFISVKGPELFNKFIGQSEENVRAIFEEASELQPSVIFFDEIDSVARSRTSAESTQHSDQFLNQLLTLMDGIEDYGKVCVIASTNRKDLLDDAIVRPGRFDYTIEIKKPTNEGCFQIFSISIRDMPVDKKFDAAAFSTKLYGLSGADIAFVAREGAYNCLRRNIDMKNALLEESKPIDLTSLVVTKMDFETALKRVSTKNSLRAL